MPFAARLRCLEHKKAVRGESDGFVFYLLGTAGTGMGAGGGVCCCCWQQEARASAATARGIIVFIFIVGLQTPTMGA